MDCVDGSVLLNLTFCPETTRARPRAVASVDSCMMLRFSWGREDE